ncbi:GAF domain-containing protein [Methylobacterium tardum]|uniref:GAF domain-containing protein n=1 Tax=Methylobacterium tardum TaxID=374432 RepID=UPI00360FEE21
MVNIDIDARKRAEDALRESEARYHELFESMAEGFAALEAVRDDEGNLTDFRHLARNPASTRVTGLHDEQVLGRLVGEVLPPEDARYWIDAYSQVFVSGEPSHFENFIPALNRWFGINVTPFGRNGVGVFYENITERKRAEAALRESEEQQAFQLQLSDALGSLTDPAEIQAEATRLLAERLDVGWCYFNEFDERGTHATVLRDFHREGVPSMVGVHDLSGERDFLDLVHSGAVLDMPDLTGSEHFSAEAKATYGELGIRSALGAPLLRNGRLAAVLLAADTRVRTWSRVDKGLLKGAAERTWVALQRTRLEAIVREREERQAFLLTLGDAMRTQSTPNAIIEIAARLLGERLNASRIMFAEFDEAKGIADIFFGWFADGAQPFPAVMRLEDYEGPILDDLREGRIVRIEDTNDPALARPDLAAIAELGVSALLSVPLLIGGKLLVNLSVHQHTPRRWTDDEVALAQEIAARLWADLVRARAEASVAAAEAWQRTLVEGIPQLVWRAARGGEWTWASPQWTAYTGQSEPDSRRWGWLEPLHPDDRPAAREVWSQAAQRDGFDVEYRILSRAGHRYRWFQTRATPVRDEAGAIVEWLGTSTDIDDLRAMQVRLEVLINELQHRSRNLLGVVTAVAGKTLRQGSTVESFEERLQALSRAQALLSKAGSDTVEVGAMVRAELAAYAQDGSEKVCVGGPEVQLTARQVQNFALALHELTTNAVKYGALKDGTGSLAVTWEVLLDRRDRRRLALSWVESGVAIKPDKVTRRGYGTELIQEALGYALEADVDYEMSADGVRCRVEMPINQPG